MSKKIDRPFDGQTMDYYDHRVYRLRHMKQATEDLKKERYKQLADKGPFDDFEALYYHQQAYVLHHVIDLFEEMHSVMMLLNAVVPAVIHLKKDGTGMEAEELQKIIQVLIPKVEKATKVTKIIEDEWDARIKDADRSSGVNKN